ncbi:TetR/AcrR family transcriptional regulator [Actinotalea sp. M2MS4P-6]|uniref:TetR/AcrR family transcriptional regulator n=1 Tax=Actinotalea sp. M2MS4P-6 TaxID=2983762 RepID=UPI0021E415E9|nr:TetR/AcrR family transcriptional regulator [Actinotalea sp. M2MS4P-6]MCV2394866.1 TetR/AcrR family transcriptional regulator [Actinotalea sp. M2MS4P-6]
MARRLAPEVRRAEIVSIARDVISTEGYSALSLREVARRCGMSAPGLMHYFPDMPSLLEAVLDSRDEEDYPALLVPLEQGASLLDVIDATLAYYDARSSETAQFDRLETEALDPAHPAHDYFAARAERQFDLLRPAIEREFDDPDAVAHLLRLMIDGMRLRALRDPGHGGMAEQWRAIRGVVARLLRRAPEDVTSAT